MNLVLVLKIILSVAFGLAGIMTIFGLKPFAKLFNEFRLNRFAMILVAIIEIACVVLLYNPALDFYAAIGLAYLTTATIYKHIKIKHPIKKYMPALILLLISMALALMLMNH